MEHNFEVYSIWMLYFLMHDITIISDFIFFKYM